MIDKIVAFFFSDMPRCPVRSYTVTKQSPVCRVASVTHGVAREPARSDDGLDSTV